MSVAGDIPLADAFDLAMNPNACVALRSTAQSIATGGGGTLISFDAEEFDNSAMFTPTSTSITIQNDGLYLVTCYVEWAANATNQRAVDIGINGVNASGMTVTLGTAAITTRMTATNQFLLTLADVVTFTAFQNSGGAINILGARAAVTRVSGN